MNLTTRIRTRPRSRGWLNVALLLIVPALATPATAEIFKDPPVLKSQSGVLDILMVARPNTKPILGLSQPVGWIYDICHNPGPGVLSCPAGPGRSQAYGGTRLALQPGDKLKVRLVNNLPPYAIGESKHALEGGRGDLALNATNIHTHGLIVEPRRPTAARPTWGDNVFVLAYNSANGVPQPAVTGPHGHGAVTNQPVDYEINIPANHPSGSYWFHSHSHGVALNQVSAGLAGIISIGEARDYACEDWKCETSWSEANVRHLILKDMMVDNLSATPKTLTQEQPTFCSQFADGSNPNEPAGSPRKGYCTGQDITNGFNPDPSNPSNTGVITNHTDGKWFFSLSGQVFPTIPVTAPQGEIWKLTNESGSNSYDLHLQTDDGNDMVMQVVSVDGVSISADSVVTPQQMTQIGGAKLHIVDCPKTPTGPVQIAPPVCVTAFKMLPSSRIEVAVSYRDATGRIAAPRAGAHATFKTVGYTTGPTGDSWPAIDLADVQFKQPAHPHELPEFVNIKGHAKTALASGGVLASAGTISPAINPPLPAGSKCAALPAGMMRRVYYGVPITNSNGFGLAAEIVPIGLQPDPTVTKLQDVTPYDPKNTVVCLTLAEGNKPVKELWQLVNLAGEVHNFHIHQTKFRVVDESAPAGSPLMAAALNPPQLPFPPGTLLHDNIPLQPATGTCNGFGEWQAGTCQPTVETLEIAFSQVGDFVYHCHILEHEDGGMMAHVAVRANP